MSFNTKVLIKIQNATSHSVKSRTIISNYISDFEEKLDKANNLDPESRKKELLQLMNEQTALRKKTLKSGVSSFTDPHWAAPAVCETWVLCLLGDDSKEIEKAKHIIHEIKNGTVVAKPQKDGKLGFLIVFVVSSLTFYLLNWWSALIVLFIGVTIIGWKYRQI